MIALDLFAGTGWGVACQALGATEYGVEIMAAAVESRRINGMATPYRDVWAGLEDESIVPEYDSLIASPPCQTFSVAGGGSGRDELDTINAAISGGNFSDIGWLRTLEADTDPRTALILSPLAYIIRDMPAHVVLEQVPQALPVWHAYASKLADLGYSVDVDVLLSEQYGVPQTRRRAILVASRVGKAALPDPTHSRYYSRESTRLDIGVKPWVGMDGVLDIPQDAKYLRSNYSDGSGGRGQRMTWEPASTVTSKTGSCKWMPTERNLTIDDAAALQSYPAGFVFAGKRADQFLQVGNAVPPALARAVLDNLS